MALVVDKNGKIIEKHLTTDLSLIKKVLSKKNNTCKDLLQRVTNTKINRRIVS